MGQFPAVPPLSVRQAFREAFASLDEMAVEMVDCAEGKVNFALVAPGRLRLGHASLGFANERLDFDIVHHLATADDGSVAGARAEFDRLLFTDFYIRNGELEIWAGSSRLSRKDAYLPHNIDLGATHENYQRLIAAADALLKQRGG